MSDGDATAAVQVKPLLNVNEARFHIFLPQLRVDVLQVPFERLTA